jgi:hypothetical protein
MRTAMSTRRRSVQVWALLAGFIVASVSCAYAQGAPPQPSRSFNFRANAEGIPISATSQFFDIGLNPDLVNTAQHELLHSIGFVTAYSRFSALVSDRGDGTGRRDFRDADGNLLAILVPPALGPHVDPDAGIVRGFDQANSIMRRDQVVGQRMSFFERDILDAAFGWTGRNLRINVIFVGQWTPSQRDAVFEAVAAAQQLFNSDGTGHEFTWTVVPEPSSLMALLVGGAALGLIRRRRTA